MATQYIPPAWFVRVPQAAEFLIDGRLDTDALLAAEQAWLGELATLARCKNSGCDIAGEVIKLHVGDGYGVYLVWDYTVLVHCRIGEVSTAPYHRIRALRASDIRSHVEWARLVASIYADGD